MRSSGQSRTAAVISNYKELEGPPRKCSVDGPLRVARRGDLLPKRTKPASAGFAKKQGRLCTKTPVHALSPQKNRTVETRPCPVLARQGHEIKKRSGQKP